MKQNCSLCVKHKNSENNASSIGHIGFFQTTSCSEEGKLRQRPRNGEIFKHCIAQIAASTLQRESVNIYEHEYQDLTAENADLM